MLRNGVNFYPVLGTIVRIVRFAQNLMIRLFGYRMQRLLLLRLIFLLTFNNPRVTVGNVVLRAIFAVAATTFIEKLGVGASQI